jgi:nitroimidazol reductase NimA-like FMN-containing flavoprotein (pyridoxamine 5'-phosphate oxidase superfamily)
MTRKYPKWMGKMRGLTNREMKQFLLGANVARIATLKNDKSPYLATVWYHYDGRHFYVGGRAKSAWIHHITENDPRVALHIARDKSPYSRVLVEGKGEVAEGPAGIKGKWLKIANKMAKRYLGSHGPEYLVPTLERPRVWIRIVPEKITTWEGVEWHRRYL